MYTHTTYSYTRTITRRSSRLPTFTFLGQQASKGKQVFSVAITSRSYLLPYHRTTHLPQNMRLSGAGVKRFCNPVKLNFTEWGNWEPIILEAVGKRKALLMTYPQAEASDGLFSNLRAVLGEDKMLWVACPELPDMNEHRGLHRRIRNFVRDRDDFVIVAVGGGSVLDLAKVMSLARSQMDFEDVFTERIAMGKRIDKLRHVPVIAVPTTAGTGSEVTPWAAVWDTKKKKKWSVQGHSLWPEAAIVDPSLSASCPREVTRNSALDALSHSLEALWNVNHNPISDVLAVAAAKGIMTHLPTILSQDERDGSDCDREIVQARIGLSTASLRAGLAFSNTETALAHAISYQITIDQGVKHGAACSFSLPRVMQMALGQQDPSRDALLHDIFSDLKAADALAGRSVKQPYEYLERFLNEEAGVSTALEDYGIAGEKDFSERVREALWHRRGKNFLLAAHLKR